MKIYRVDYYDKDEGALIQWFSNRRDATLEMHRMVRERGPSQGFLGVRAIDVPTTRRDLISWLNSNYNQDNG